MSAVDNIFMTFAVIAIFLIVGVVIMGKTSDNIMIEQQAEQTAVELDSYETNLDSILMIQEKISQRSFGNLIGDTIFYRDNILNFSNTSINVSAQLQEVLDYAYGKGKYYFTIKPEIDNITLIFLFDGSNSLQEEREIVASRLNSIMTSLETKFGIPISAFAYVLAKNETKCDTFGSIACETLKDNDIYQCYGSVCFSAPPSTDDFDKALYYESDWAAGASFIVNRLDNIFSHIKIVFPVSEELSTSSIPNRCFVTDFEFWSSQITCDVCDPVENTTINRSLYRVNKLINLSKNKEGLVMYPINAHPKSVDDCEYGYNTVSELLRINFESEYNLTLDNYCGVVHEGEQICPGCVDNPADPNLICFHPEAADNIQEQMERVGLSTPHGGVIALQNVDELPEQLEATISEIIESFEFNVGEFKEDTTRFAFERKLPLPGISGDYAILNVWIYEGTATMNTSLDHDPPKVIVNVDPPLADVGEVFNISADTWDASGIASSSFELSFEDGTIIEQFDPLNNSFTYEFDSTGRAEGSYTVKVNARDNNGLISTEYAQFVIGGARTPKLLEINYTWEGSVVEFKLRFDQPGILLENVRLTMKQNSVSVGLVNGQIGSGIVTAHWDTLFAPLGNISVDVFYQNVYGFENTTINATFIWINDTIPPTIGHVEVTPDVGINDTPFEIDADVNDNLEVDEIIIQVTFPNGTKINLTADENGHLELHNPDWPIGHYEIDVIATDIDGNAAVKENAGEFEIIIDTVAPIINSVTVSPPTGTNKTTFKITADVFDNVEVANVTFRITKPDVTTEDFEASPGTSEYDLVSPNWPVGVYTITVIATDSSGNTAEGVDLASFEIVVGDPILIATVTSMSNALGQTLEDYKNALMADEYYPIVVNLDNQASVDQCGVSGLSSTSVPVSDTAARTIINNCLANGDYDFEYLIIIGGWNQIHQRELPAGSGPGQCGDPTGRYYTDDWLTDISGSDGRPDIPYGRIPVGLNNDIEPAKNYIEKVAIPLHSTQGKLTASGTNFGYLIRMGGTGLCLGSEESFVYDNFGSTCTSLTNSCYYSPSDFDGGPRWSEHSDYVFIVHHGPYSPNPQRFSDESSPSRYNVRPDNIPLRDLTNSVMIMVPCYGGRLSVQSTSDSAYLSAFASNTPPAAYLGGTATQLGQTGSPRPNACEYDYTSCLYTRYMYLRTHSDTIGQAYTNAKRAYLASSNAPCTQRVGHQTHLYGDPTLKFG